MALSLICACGARFDVEDTVAGQEVVCPECQQAILAPALRKPSLRTHDLALLSTVLALVGAFTVVGTMLAVVFGALGLWRIHANRDRFAGAGFALFGMVAGTLFTVLTILALSSDRTFGIAGAVRRNQLADRVDTSGELTFENAPAGFQISRPSREWGVSSVARLEEPHVTAIQGNKAGGEDLLLVNMRRVLYVDVRAERVQKVDISVEEDRALNELKPAVQDLQFPPARGRFRRQLEDDDDTVGARITKVEWAPNARKVAVAGKGEALERDVTIWFGRERWTMVHRVYQAEDDRIFIVRAFGPKRHFPSATDDDVRKVLDSFTIIDGR